MADPEAFWVHNQKRGDIAYHGGNSARDWRLLSQSATNVGGALLNVGAGKVPIYGWPYAINRTFGAKAYRSAGAGAQAIPGTGVFTTLVFDTVDYDYNSNYNAGTGVYTAPLTGLYIITAGSDWASGGTDIVGTTYAIAAFVNGVERFRIGHHSMEVGATAGLLEARSGASIEALTAADTVDIRAFNNSGANRNFMTGARLGSFAVHFFATL